MVSQASIGDSDDVEEYTNRSWTGLNSNSLAGIVRTSLADGWATFEAVTLVMEEWAEIRRSGIDDSMLKLFVSPCKFEIVTDIDKVSLFVAIITTFQVPASQNLSAHHAGLTTSSCGT